MVRLKNSLLTALLCGAIGLAGSAFAQAGGGAIGGTAGSVLSTTPGALPGSLGSMNYGAGNGAAGSTLSGASGSIYGSSLGNGPGAINRPVGPNGVLTSTGGPMLGANGLAGGAVNQNTSAYGVYGNAPAGGSLDQPSFLGTVQSQSTPASGLNGSEMTRVDGNERRITSDLNRASAASMGNANAANQGAMSAGNRSTIQ